MVFSSHIFLFYFLPLSLLFYYCTPRRGKNIILTGISYIFYGWSNPLFTLLMFFSTLVDYCCGLIIGRATEKQIRRSKIALCVSIISNLSLLGFFKYTSFAMESYNQLFSLIGVNDFDPVPVLRFLLPVPLLLTIHVTMEVHFYKPIPIGCRERWRMWLKSSQSTSMAPIRFCLKKINIS